MVISELKNEQRMELLRFITAGSVDDGKSTLIGRLLYDSKNILVDQMEQLERHSAKKQKEGIDLALLTDGLRAEREQGITIDVAYRYFSTPRRKFIIADAPGHVQYTRNMVTGASNANLIIILVDARQGVVEQTRRHSIIASLLRIPQVVVAVNKMDLVGYSEDVYNNIVIDYAAVADQLGLTSVRFFPISALAGDNIVDGSRYMPWYEGPALLNYLEEVPVDAGDAQGDPRFQVQLVIRPQTEGLHDYRGYAGRMQSGRFRKGDKVTILPSGHSATISQLEIAGVEVEEVHPRQSVVIRLVEDIDISRGDSIVAAGKEPALAKEFDVLLSWLDEKPLKPGNRYLLRHHARTVRVIVRDIAYKLDVNTLQQTEAGIVTLNEVVKASLKCAEPLVFERYADAGRGGAAILVDETSNSTVAAVLFQSASEN
jgi:sulfate adenylyltransferase subunit 1